MINTQMRIVHDAICLLHGSLHTYLIFQDMATPAADWSLLSAMAITLRGFIQTYAEDREDFLRLARTDEDIRQLLYVMLQVRANQRSRISWAELCRELRRRWPSRYTQQLLDDAYAVYRAVRMRAYPSARQSTLESTYAGFLTRRMRRTMVTARVGVQSAAMRLSVHERAVEAIEQLWNILPAVCCLIWFDNFYRARYMSNPARGDVSLNSTVLAVLPLQSLPGTMPNDLNFADMLDGLPVVVIETMDVQQVAQRLVATLCSRNLTADDVRVPLDEQRPFVRSLPWTPLMVSDTCVSSQLGLLAFLGACREIAERGRRHTAPLLVDMNIHYRLIKLACGRSTVLWDIPRLLRPTPPLFGIWHAYKYCVVMVARQFHSLLWYAAHGTIVPGDTRPTSPALMTYELIIAAILMVPFAFRTGFGDLLAEWIRKRDDNRRVFQECAVTSGHRHQNRFTSCQFF